MKILKIISIIIFVVLIYGLIEGLVTGDSFVAIGCGILLVGAIKAFLSGYTGSSSKKRRSTLSDDLGREEVERLNETTWGTRI